VTRQRSHAEAPADPARVPDGDAAPRRINADRESIERGLVTLILTLVELPRQLMERQALRRVEDGTLDDDKIEEVGQTLQALDERMSKVTEQFGLARADLNLDLGPLRPLLRQ
jgi:Gas vesicle protein K